MLHAYHLFNSIILILAASANNGMAPKIAVSLAWRKVIKFLPQQQDKKFSAKH